MLIFDKLFFKYKLGWGVGGGGSVKLTPVQKKLPSKSPALLGLKASIATVSKHPIS